MALRPSNLAAESSLRQGERFRVERELGRGGMGIVLLVEDRLRGQRVALKRVRRDTGLDIWRLKHEFRAIEGLAHPNVVSVYELGTDDQGPFLLMEAVDGVHLQEWCGAGPRELPSDSGVSRVDAGSRVAPAPDSTQRVIHDKTTASLEHHEASDIEAAPAARRASLRRLSPERLERLYGAGAQLLSALSCLHEQGLVHRDLKPANVLVQPDGTVKLLDFGILGEAGATSIDARAGSAAYMAPEQIAGAPAEARSDLYAFGIMAFEIVTGVLPFCEASIEDTLTLHLHAEALRAHTLAPDCPMWLSSLIAWLLQKQPEERPSLNDLAEIWTSKTGHSVVQRERGASTLELVERAHEQRVLLDLLDGPPSGFAFVAICGDSGLGKSALLDWTRRAAYFRRLTVLRSRTRFSERVPFNALDGLVDDLLTLLQHFPELGEDREGIALRCRAGSVFPVLRPRGTPVETVEPRQAFEALLDLLSRCARVTGRVILLCDDLQWADADSVALLARLVELRPREITLIATVRSDTHTDAFARFWKKAMPEVKLALAPLSQLALGHIIMRVAAEAGREVALDVAEAVAPSCGGRPLLARAFGRVIARTDATATEFRSRASARPITWLIDGYAADGVEQRRLLPLLGVLDGKVALPQLVRLTGLSFGELDATLAPLVREGLLVAAESLGERRSYDFSHDLIRREVTDRLSPEDARAAHAAVVDDLAASGAPSAGWVRHLLGAERYEQAAEVALVSARAAGTAYGLAAELYQIAIEHTRADTVPLRAERAEALELLGRYVEAAREWAAVVERTSGEAQVDALLQQAKAWFGTEHLSEGKRVMDLARQMQKKQASVHDRVTDLTSPIRFMLGAWALPGPRRILRDGPSSAAHRRDVVLATMQSFFDPLAGIRALVRCRVVCRQQGNRVQAAEADYVLAYIAFWASSKQSDHQIGESYVKSAHAALGFVPGPEHERLYALELQTLGTLCLRKGEWKQAAAHFNRAIALLEELGLEGAFDHVFHYINLQSAERFSQDLVRWERTLDKLQLLTDVSPDSLFRYEVAFGRTGLLIMRGQFEEALLLARQARDRWQTQERSYVAFMLDLFVLLPEMYLSDGAEAHPRITQLFKTYAHFRPTSGMYRGFMLSQLAWFEAAALRKQKKDASFRKVLHWAKEAELSCPLHRHVAIRAAAYACDTMGKPERALDYLRRAEACALTAQQPIEVAIARYQLGLRLGGAEGAALQKDAEHQLESTGAHRALLLEDPARR